MAGRQGLAVVMLFICILNTHCCNDIDLSEDTVMTIQGAGSFHHSGFNVRSAGDVNGDGFDDLIVGTFLAGVSHVVFGGPNRTNADLAGLGSRGFTIQGRQQDHTGEAVSGAGDVNGDGFHDIIVGESGATVDGKLNAGKTYVILGGPNPTDVNVQNLGARGFTIHGAAAADRSGYSVSDAGDVNGDGFADIIIGAPWSNFEAGTSYVIYGASSPTDVDLSVSLGARGFIVYGAAAGERSGRSVAAAGDVNNDGFADVVIGAPDANPLGRLSAGIVYVIYGAASSTDVNASASLGDRAFVILGAVDQDKTGVAVRGAGDVNGDGYADVIMGAYLASRNGRVASGLTYVIYGGASPSDVDLRDQLSVGLGTRGFLLLGAFTWDMSGIAVSGAGDVNGDGLADVIVGAHGTDPLSREAAGVSYVIFGAPQPTNIDLRRSLGTRGFVVRGAAAEDASGYSVSAAGDVDGDGVADVVIAAPTADPLGRTSGGSSYVLAGCAAVGCSAAERSLCSDDAWCTRADDDTVTCTCAAGLLDVHGNGSVCEDVNECEETAQCHVHAECENTHGSFFCVCAAGFVGDGASCSGDAWAVRTVFAISEASELGPEAVQELKHQYAMLVAGRNLLLNSPLVTSMPVAAGALHYGDGLMEVDAADGRGEMTLMALFAQESDAQAAVAMLESVADAQYWQLLGAVRAVVDGPKLYRWSVDPIQVNPTGLTVDSVWFDSSCLASGCWRIDVTFTAGSDNVNVLYLPRTDGADDLSYDQSYDDVTAPWSVSPEDTFDPRTLPCTTVDYERSQNPLATPASVTACCIPEFVAMFRPVSTFEPALSAELKATMSSVCGAGARDRDVTRASIPIIAQRGQPVGGNVYARPVAPEMDGMSSDVFQAESHGIFGHGRFAGMPLSRVNATATVDAYVGVYRATVFLDEVEARTLAGRLRGTVGVEHSVDTFVGLAEFSPTGQFVLDPFMTQTNIHLEKTGFFSVSTHGTNDYTFLQYVNLRLVAVYAEEGGDDVAGAGARTARVNATNAAHYVQVTFTLGEKYEVNTNSGLVPLDSVRAGAGTFVDAEGRGLAHKCTEWVSGSLPGVSQFNATLMQSCAPAAAMCVSPSAIPDSFVAFNVPLGVDFFAAPSDSLSNNVFVDMVISAVDTEARGNNPQPTDPNGGEAPWQMKTTLTASIPVVEGGVNIFCDGYTAKTDLQDVANADVVVGTASSAEELTRLRIKEDIASTQLSESAITQIDSDSIEAGLMTLVLKGDASYFESNTGRREVTLELEDVITIHVMESDTGQGQSADVASSVLTLVTTAPADAGPEDTDSYGLNGAFKFTIDRSAQRAHLEPTDALLVLCPFSAPRPANNLKLETCVTRRDVRHRGFPHRSGAVSTAMEICAGDGDCSDETTSSHEARFMVSVLGDSAYARQLAVDYATVIADAYSLNGRYKRAYWINPGYEWTPTQTGGTPLFSVSQKLFLFALVTLDEGLSTDDGAAAPALQLPSRRRMLLQSTPEEALQDGQAALNADAFEFQTSRTSMMAKAFGVPEDRVATFKVTLQLTSAEACMATTELQASIRTTLDDFVSGAASAFHTVQIASLALDRAGVQCSARRRVLLSSYSGASAEVTMLVVFKAGGAPAISLSQLLTMPGVAAVEPLTVPAHVDTTPDVVRPSSSTSSKSSNSAVLIAAAAGGSVAAVVVAAVGVLLVRRNKVQVEMATVHSVDVTALKRDLEDDL